MKSKLHCFFIFIVFGVLIKIYSAWFFYKDIIGGDWPYHYKEYLDTLSVLPQLWSPWRENGMGGVDPILNLATFQNILIVPFTQWLHIPWNIVYKVFWYGLFLFLSVFSAWKLSKTVLQDKFQFWHGALSGLIYCTNTYILMLVGGGQMGVALAYSIAPLVLARFINLIDFSDLSGQKFKIQSSKFKVIILTGLTLAVQVMFDPRIAYVALIAIGVYILVSFLHQKKGSISKYTVNVLLSCFGAGIVGLLLNAFWILPMVFLRSSPLDALGSTFTSAEAVKFFSFADFSHALSLLHPNWPENIFGKTYFLQPEFLILPLLAFASLIFVNFDKFCLPDSPSRSQGPPGRWPNAILFLALMGLLGAFLAKGANPPFGSVYVWLFERVPGFVMFRDPTKFYLLIAISYSVLIPYVIHRFGKYTYHVAIFVVVLWLVTIRQALGGELGGTFARHTVPSEYKELQAFLDADTEFSRTLWVPRQSRFSYASLDHMATEAEPLFGATNPAQLKEKLELPGSRNLVSNAGIGYVMIPYDSMGELFLKDRKYDDALRKEYETVLDYVPWLTKINSGNITVYKTSEHKDLFSLTSGETVSYRRQRVDQYGISFVTAVPSELYFSQNYNPGWVFVHKDGRISAQKTDTGLSVFPIPEAGIYEGTIFFEPQKYVDWVIVVSLVSFIVAVVVLVS